MNEEVAPKMVRIDGEHYYNKDTRAEVLSMSAATIDRYLKADVVIVCIGASELAQDALILARDGGRVNYFAGFPKGSMTQMEPNLIHWKDLQVARGSNARRRDVKGAIRVLESGAINVEEIVAHTFPLSKVHEAYQAVHDRVGVKIAVIPD
ncbi:hypothetical protein [Actinomyces sp.]|uniref:hypothetical protein n=1 Tax=Actinomyces sp. TaxID=29317 RepID=UPI00290F3F7F|nr:hypothetical protein [Actinomyces sp.]MDU5568153.1 hypothetical protein [Actinomyces sp.]